MAPQLNSPNTITGSDDDQKRVHALFRSASDISSHEEALNKLLTEFMDGGGQDGFNQRPINDPISPSRAQTDHQDPPGSFSAKSTEAAAIGSAQVIPVHANPVAASSVKKSAKKVLTEVLTDQKSEIMAASSSTEFDSSDDDFTENDGKRQRMDDEHADSMDHGISSPQVAMENENSKTLLQFPIGFSVPAIPHSASSNNTNNNTYSQILVVDLPPVCVHGEYHGLVWFTPSTSQTDNQTNHHQAQPGGCFFSTADSTSADGPVQNSVLAIHTGVASSIENAAKKMVCYIKYRLEQPAGTQETLHLVKITYLQPLGLHHGSAADVDIPQVQYLTRLEPGHQEEILIDGRRWRESPDLPWITLGLNPHGYPILMFRRHYKPDGILYVDDENDNYVVQVNGLADHDDGTFQRLMTANNWQSFNTRKDNPVETEYALALLSKSEKMFTPNEKLKADSLIKLSKKFPGTLEVTKSRKNNEALAWKGLKYSLNALRKTIDAQIFQCTLLDPSTGNKCAAKIRVWNDGLIAFPSNHSNH